MSDNDLLDLYRIPLAGVHMAAPADAVMARGEQWRHQRQRTRWAAVGGSGVVAAAIALTLIATGGGTSRRDQTGAQLAAFTLTGGPGGTTTLTLHKNSSIRLDPEQLRLALAQRGIAALVKVGSWCDTAVEPTGLRQAVSVVKDANGDPALSIQPSAIPTGAELSIGYYPTRTVLGLIQTNAPQICAALPRDAAATGQGIHDAVVITNG